MLKQTFILSTLAICLFISCGTNNSGSSKKASKPDLKLYVFDVGQILMKDVSMFNYGETGEKLLTNSAYLIRHPEGDLIWDTGFPDSLVALPEGLDSEMATIKMPLTLKGQLNDIGLKPEEIEYLALSHLHPDHVGNANLFTAAKLLFQQEEYNSLFKNGQIATDVDLLQDNSFLKLTGDHDVFGDGTVIIKRAPGHTRGHQVLYVELPETGPIVLSGDLFITTKQRETKGVPEFNVSKAKTLETMATVEGFIKEKNATLWIQHDLEQNLDISRSPKFHK